MSHLSGEEVWEARLIKAVPVGVLWSCYVSFANSAEEFCKGTVRAPALCAEERLAC